MIEFNEQDIAVFRSLVEGSRSVALVSHTNADGDAMGSLLATRRVVEAHSKAKVTTMLPSPRPDVFEYLPGYGEIVIDTDSHELCTTALMEADLIIAVDMNNASRVDNLAQALNESKAHKVLIDHHHSPDRELFHVLFSLPEFSSACELAYWLFVTMYGEEAIDRETARCLYSGICTDTGFFSYSCESPSVFEAAGRLVAKGIDPAGIHDLISNCFSVERMRFYGFALSERLVIMDDVRAAYFHFSLEDQRRFKVEPQDMEGLVNYTLMMKRIEVGVLMREEPARVKLSFRAKGDFDVSAFANRLFGGGGHTKAAGANSTLGLDATISLVEQKLREALKKQ